MGRFDDLRNMQPLLINSKKKKKKRKYSRGLRELQLTGGRLTNIGDQMARSSSKGMRRFRSESKASARERQDGAIRDLGLNMAKGLGASLEAARPIPEDMARALSTRGSRKAMRRQMKIAAKLSRSLGLK